MKPLSETSAERLERLGENSSPVEGGWGASLVGGGLLIVILVIVVVGFLVTYAMTGMFGGYSDAVRDLTPQP